MKLIELTLLAILVVLWGMAIKTDAKILTIGAEVRHDYKLKGTLPLQETQPVQQTLPGWEFQKAGIR